MFKNIISSISGPAYKKAMYLTLTVNSLLIFADLFISPIFLVYLKGHLGINSSGVVMVMAFLSVFIMLLDYPTSHIADVWDKLKVAMVGTLSLSVGLFIYGFSDSLALTIIGVFFKALGLAVISGTLSSWFVDQISQREDFDVIREKYITLSTITQKTTIVVSLIISYFVINYLSKQAVFAISSSVYAFASLILFVAIHHLSQSKTEEYQWDNYRSLLDAKPLVSFLRQSLQRKEHRFIYSIQILFGLGFVIYITFWQLVAEEVELESHLPTLTLLGFIVAWMGSWILPFLDRDALRKYKYSVISGIIFSLLIINAFCFVNLSGSKYFFLGIVFSFQLLITFLGVWVQGKTMEYAPDANQSAKYFSLSSTLSELVNSSFLFFNSFYLVKVMPDVSLLFLYCVPFSVLLVLLVTRLIK